MKTNKQKKLFYPDDDGGISATMSDKEFISFARGIYEKMGEIEIDNDAKVSRGTDHGAYVQAWVWVDDNVPSDGSAPKEAKFALTKQQLNRIKKSLGRYPDAKEVEMAIDANKNKTPQELERSLRIASAIASCPE